MFTMRFDMRAPTSGASTRDLYAAALDMAEWGDRNGCLQIQVSEHHGSSDGYLPVPIVLASALSSRTHSIGIQVAALLVPLHDPIELAEQMAGLDIVSKRLPQEHTTVATMYSGWIPAIKTVGHTPISKI